MMNIQDISPTLPNTNRTAGTWQSVSGRTLAFASSPDGEIVFAGSYANIWRSQDDGQTWQQVVWPQPPPGQFGVSGSLGGWGVVDLAVFGGWRVEKHLRLLADVRGNGRADIVGFKDAGVTADLSNADGTFTGAQFVVGDLGFDEGWRVEKHVRLLADLTGNRRADIVGFGDAGVWTALSNPDGTFAPPKFVVADFGYDAGGWRVENHPRFLADLSGNLQADFIGFGNAGVWTALSNGDGTFQTARLVIEDFGYNAGWRVDRHPRFLADLTGNGRADFVGFGDAGVWTALSNGDGTFQGARLVVADLCYGAGGWRVEKHPRFLADLTGNGRADIIGFGDAGVWTALSNGDGTFAAPQFVLANFGYAAGSWRIEAHPRFLADLTGDGRADIVGFGEDGVWTALGNGDGTFAQPRLVVANFGSNAGGWRVDRHPRVLADLTGNGRADIVGFGDVGVWTALSNGDGSFAPPAFVLENFGYEATVLAITRNDRESSDNGIWRSADAGSTWVRVHQFPQDGSGQIPPPAGQLVIAPGNDQLVYAAGGSALAISRDGGGSFTNALPLPTGPSARFNHVAVSAPSAGGTWPDIVYVIGDGALFVSLDGQSFFADQGTIPNGAGGSVGSANVAAPSVLVVSPRDNLEVFLVTSEHQLWRGRKQGRTVLPPVTWETVNGPNLGPQDSGNIFVVAPRSSQGNVLFYSPQRSNAYVSIHGLDPGADSDWRKLDPDSVVHVDLHGLFLSPTFQATLNANSAQWEITSGTIWLLSDGGIFRSTDGGKHFAPTQNLNTLSSVNVAGVAIAGSGGPALSLNTGDNDGFYSVDGGAHWESQHYGGGDNDCSYADPLRPHSMLVFTPRWDHGTVTLYESAPGHLPDARKTSNNGHTVPGPPLAASGPIWNATSFYALRGFRPIVLNLPGDDVSAPGDYIFIRFRSPTQSVLLRTRSILQIDNRNDWDSNPARVSQQGPDLPHPDLNVVQASGGHEATVFYVGGNALNELWLWSGGMPNWERLVPGPGASQARRFFVSPYNPALIYVMDEQNVKRSDDGGKTWQIDQSLETQLTGGARIPIARPQSSDLGDQADVVLMDMQFDPHQPLVRFAVGEGGVFYTNDGANWNRLLDSGAVPGRPMNCYYDWISNPSERALFVAFAGRGLVKIGPLPSQALPTVPDVVQTFAAEAAKTVRAAGFVPKFTGPNAPTSWVFSQSPAAGDVVAAGSTVSMLLHTGPLP